jgi:AraC-like DNA-binding protein
LGRLLVGGPAGCALVEHGGGGTVSQFICGSFLFENAAGSPLLALLPPLIHVRRSESEPAEWLASTLQLLAYEARQTRPGAKAVISLLTEIIFVQAVRAWMEDQPAGEGGWLRALRDPQIGAALELIHRAPERSWSVAALAREVAMSRSPFAARFTALVGEPPLAYLTRWRMHRAARLLQSDHLTVSEIAELVGYESAAAFSKAFKRRFGVPPGAHRQPAVPATASPPVGEQASKASSHASRTNATRWGVKYGVYDWKYGGDDGRS